MTLSKTFNFRFLILIACLFQVENAMSQAGAGGNMLLNDNLGRPIAGREYVDIKGSPFLTEDWIKGIVKLENGDTFKDIDLKLNVKDYILLFKGKNNEALAFVKKPLEFRLYDRLFRTGYNLADKSDQNAYYEVLYDGGAKLLKLISKDIKEAREYNSATTTKTFVETAKYYIAIDGNSLVEITRSKNSILGALKGPKVEQVKKYLSENKLNLKDDADLVKIFAYYDSI
ncbi:hypothetical protein [Pedobacter gandavensis]|uniref:hypothetical protein n=1 Tax=Pedobacter gandavensis TaxID=2679963 RepID=UPI002931D8E5|nr:hypothetical protein [Pedobacter gandavensis]